MAMSVYNAQYKLGIDRTTLQQVSQEILKRANEKNSQYNVHTTTNNIFKPADIGVDLYNGKVDVNTAKQIALNNSGLQVQLSQDALNSIKYLNSQATQNVQKNVEGKITVALNEGVGNTSLATGKDKNGSAPSYKGEFLFIKKDKDNEEIVA